MDPAMSSSPASSRVQSAKALSFLSTDVTTPENYRVDVTAHVTARDRATGKVLLDKDVNGYTLVQVGTDLAERRTPVAAAAGGGSGAQHHGIADRRRVVNCRCRLASLAHSVPCFNCQNKKPIQPHEKTNHQTRRACVFLRATAIIARRCLPRAQDIATNAAGGCRANPPVKPKKHASSRLAVRFRGTLTAVDTNAMTLTVGKRTFDMTSETKNVTKDGSRRCWPTAWWATGARRLQENRTASWKRSRSISAVNDGKKPEEGIRANNLTARKFHHQRRAATPAFFYCRFHQLVSPWIFAGSAEIGIVAAATGCAPLPGP
jgi:hypothetical protein